METGTIFEISTTTNVGMIAPNQAGKGAHVAFGPDSMVVGQFHELRVGQQVWFEREVLHGEHPAPVRVRNAAPAEREVEALVVSEDKFERLDA